MKRKPKLIYLSEKKAREVILPLIDGIVLEICKAVDKGDFKEARGWLKDLVECFELTENIKHFIEWEEQKLEP